jgi:hypothetical protein
MKLRKLTPTEAAQLCACLALPAEWGHRRDCPHFLAKRAAYRLRHVRKWRAKRRATRVEEGNPDAAKRTARAASAPDQCR